MSNALPAPTIQTGDKVRLQLPNWDSPGPLVYTVTCVAGAITTVRAPKVPGLNGTETRRVPTEQVHPA